MNIRLGCMLLVVGMSACASSPKTDANSPQTGPCPAPPIEIFLQADTLLNTNEQAQSMPVEVRIFLLRSRERFEQLDFEEVWKSAEDELGKDVVSTASVTVFPGKLKIHTLKATNDVAFVALVGVFREPEDRSWQYIVDVREKNRRCVSANADEALHTIVQAELKGNTISERVEP